MDKLAAAKFLCISLLEKPLEVMASDNSSLLEKTVSAVAIAAFSLLSLGYYVIYAYRFFADKKIIHLQKELEGAIERGDLYRVRNLFQDHPILKTEKDRKDPSEDSHISTMLPLAAERECLDGSEDLEMVELLCDNGATLNVYSRGMKTPLERALESNHEGVARYLLDKGARLDQDVVFRYAMQKGSNLDMLFSLVEKLERIETENKIWSILGLASLKYDNNPDKCKEVMKLLIEKGDRLTKRDLKLQISDEAKQFIDDQLKLVA